MRYDGQCPLIYSLTDYLQDVIEPLSADCYSTDIILSLLYYMGRFLKGVKSLLNERKAWSLDEELRLSRILNSSCYAFNSVFPMRRVEGIKCLGFTLR